MDKALRRTWVIALVGSLALLANITYVQGFEAQALRDDRHNARQFQNRDKINRGPIVADGERLAWSVPVSGGRYQRRYLDSEIFAPVTGYFSQYSQSGLENAENRLLDGTDPRLATTSLIDRVIGRKVAGGAVEATVDPDAQRAAYRALRATGARRAAAVALDTRTGAIKVMASTPSYDANTVSTLDTRRADAAFERLNADRLKPMLNKAIGETFPPGSTFKTVTAAAALAAGTTAQTPVPARRSYTPPGAARPINNDEGDIGGECDLPAIPLINSYAQSCNTTFARMGAERPGGDAIGAQARRYGFGQRIEIARGMSSAPSAYPVSDPALDALGAMGQGSTVATPLQMAMVAAASVNGGQVMRPYLVERVRGADGSVVEQTRPGRLSQALTADQAAQLKRMMRAVVERGTADDLRGTAVEGGKTGTADVDNASYNDRWFIGFGSHYAVAVMTEAPGYGIKSGPAAAAILEALGR
ncbi:penicillin-binding transpeptidase domain-containing protein [Actinomadura kijaniata]|uniref:penicillin-binding transpeptidase domain-containing protein n=1 Tax=Actinomadura kijaniata TaxID=46161 RepID=UPI0008320DBE|nr:penicillin-binding transpeptidase domain-containing protein [Actinomadura kijaniata]